MSTERQPSPALDSLPLHRRRDRPVPITRRVRRPLAIVTAIVAIMAVAAGRATATEHTPDDTYDEKTILETATGFFGQTTEGLAKVIQKVFEEQGRPNAYITGEEASGAFVVGLRYGNGTLNRKNQASRKIYWQGPSVGFDVGGNASKVFVLIYHLPDTEQIFRRFPGGEGIFYFVAGIGVNYQQSGDIILAPIRTGVGLRTGVNLGYLHYSKKHSWIPF